MSVAVFPLFNGILPNAFEHIDRDRARCRNVWWWQVSSIPRISATGELNYSFALYTISYFVVVNWTLLQVWECFMLA
jgi:hypothetical protein